jgi:hypothetical protein
MYFACITMPFTLEETEFSVNSVKPDTAPGPDGIPVFLYKHFWPILKHQIFMLLNLFSWGFIPLKHLNFGVFSLIPKILCWGDVKLVNQVSSRTLIGIALCLHIFSLFLPPKEDPNGSTMIVGACHGESGDVSDDSGGIIRRNWQHQRHRPA